MTDPVFFISSPFERIYRRSFDSGRVSTGQKHRRRGTRQPYRACKTDSKKSEPYFVGQPIGSVVRSIECVFSIAGGSWRLPRRRRRWLIGR